jgi:urease accessory protein UreF
MLGHDIVSGSLFPDVITLEPTFGKRKISDMIAFYRVWEAIMGLAETEKELAGKTARFLKAEMKRAGVTYAELAKRLEEHGLRETKASIANKFSRGTIAATLFLAVLAALGLDGIQLEDL